jgi:hypothetical protein
VQCFLGGHKMTTTSTFLDFILFLILVYPFFDKSLGITLFPYYGIHQLMKFCVHLKQRRRILGYRCNRCVEVQSLLYAFHPFGGFHPALRASLVQSGIG